MPRKQVNLSLITPLILKLNQHPIYSAVKTTEDLKCFMEHHVFSVWDFMSLVKYLQAELAPSAYPWRPIGDGNVRQFINELVLEEESDQTTESGKYSSHFELYVEAMREIGANTAPIERFIKTLESNGLQAALDTDTVPVPAPSKHFTSHTFQLINSKRTHSVAAAMALGREHIIPGMFLEILDKAGVRETDAPTFHYYLERHIHLDGDQHGPASLHMLNTLCDNDEQKIKEAETTAIAAIEARIKFWDQVLNEIQIGQQKNNQ